jgi:hypothetical protein
MEIGDKILTIEGYVETVKQIRDMIVATEESLRTGSWYSEKDVVPVSYRPDLEQYVPIRESA